MVQHNPVSSNKFFILSFLPAVAYWYLEANYSIKVAVIGGIAIGLLEMLLEFIFFKHVHKISKLNFVLLVFLGLISMIGQDGFWYKLQPMIGGIVISIIWFINIKRNKSFFEEFMPGEKLAPLGGREGLLHIEKINLGFIFFNSVFMGFVALRMSTDAWLFFKTIGGYLIFGGFLIGQLIYLRFYLKRIHDRNMKAMLFRKL
jgi:intracellular septation protein